MKRSALLLVVLLLPVLLFAEKRPKNKMKFGKISMEEFQIKSTELDTTADAIILGDFHNYSMDFYPNLGLKTTIDVYRRVLILNPDGVDQLANISIRLYHKNQSSDKLSRFKASTYNLVNGEIEETKLDKESIFTEKSGNWDIKKYAFNNVKEGSIIEYHYTIMSDYFQFPTYYPQQEFPVFWSELVFQYYDEIAFKYNYAGNTTPLFHNEENINQKIAHTWIFSNVPPLKQESFMGPVKNYQTNIDYELRSIEIPGFLYKNYTSSWQEIAKDYMQNEHAGKLMYKARYFKDIVDHVNADPNITSDTEKVFSALSYIRSNYLWNGRNSDYPSYEFNKVISDKKGNSADLNILLLGSLQSLGIIARPVLMSTKNNGWILRSNPSSEDLNYMITSFDLDGNRHFVDVATSYSGIDALPAKCLNGEAVIADEANMAWVELSPHMKYHRRVFVQANLDEDLTLSGICQTKENDYAGQSIRSDVKKEGSIEEYIEKQKNGLDDFEISEYEVNDLEMVSNPVSLKFQFSTENAAEELGDIVALNPILFKDFDENPFKKDHREFAIDFSFPIALEYTYIINIPESYTFDELPKPTKVSNSDNSISFLLNTVALGQSATITLKLEIKKAMYLADQYADLKTFFDYFISQQNQPILIKEL